MSALPYASHFRRRDEILGLEVPARILWGALERGQVPSAYLIKGPASVGKTTLAVAYAQAATCLTPRPSPFGACETCDSCRRVAKGTQPEVVLIQPAGDQTQIWQLWDREGRPPGALEHSLPYSPQLGARRVYILERADTLTPAAANSMLKALEEAPPYAVFLLLTTSAERILPTVLSRCQTIAAVPPPLTQLEAWLRDVHGVPEERVRVVSALAEGMPGAALRLVQQDGALAEIESVVSAALRWLEYRPLAALKAAEEMRKLAGTLKAHAIIADAPEDGETSEDTSGRARAGRRGLATVLGIVMSVIRDLVALSVDPNVEDIVHRAHIVALRTHAPTRSPAQWHKALDVLIQAQRRLEQNVPAQLVSDWVATAILVPR